MMHQDSQQTPLDFLPEAMVDEMLQEYTVNVLSKVNSYLLSLEKYQERDTRTISR